MLPCLVYFICEQKGAVRVRRNSLAMVPEYRMFSFQIIGSRWISRKGGMVSRHFVYCHDGLRGGQANGSVKPALTINRPL
jgi:hypothetical protein